MQKYNEMINDVELVKKRVYAVEDFLKKEQRECPETRKFEKFLIKFDYFLEALNFYDEDLELFEEEYESLRDKLFELIQKLEKFENIFL